MLFVVAIAKNKGVFAVNYFQGKNMRYIVFVLFIVMSFAFSCSNILADEYNDDFHALFLNDEWKVTVSFIDTVISICYSKK